MRRAILWAVVAMLVIPVFAETRVRRLVLPGVESLSFEGWSVGTNRHYGRLIRCGSGKRDPTDPLSAGSVNIATAPQNLRGALRARWMTAS